MDASSDAESDGQMPGGSGGSGGSGGTGGGGSGGDQGGSGGAGGTGGTMMPPDAGCMGEDSDGDMVCDSEDNCPELSNASQTDTDGDDRGDACDPPCGADPLAESIQLDHGLINAVMLNNGTNIAEVSPGEAFSLQLNYQFNQCSVIGVPVQMQVGFEGADQAKCLVAALCVLNQPGPADTMITAPQDPGVYYLRARMTEGPTCPAGAEGPWLSTLPSDERVAAICVR